MKMIFGQKIMEFYGHCWMLNLHLATVAGTKPEFFFDRTASDYETDYYILSGIDHQTFYTQQKGDCISAKAKLFSL